jgi:hypothetical protein
VGFQRQRRTQTAEYWGEEFALNREDLEYLYEWLVEEGEPRTTDELGLKVIERRCHKEERALSKQSSGQVYLPQETYEVGQRVVFPIFDYALGQVLAIRDGNNPRYGAFQVIQVKLDNEDQPREFVANFAPDHPLRRSAPSLEDGGDILSAQQLYAQHASHIREKIEEKLHKTDDYVYLDGRWLLRGLLPEVTPFQLNIAEAIIDERHQPLAIGQLLERTIQVLDEMGMTAEGKPAVRAYALAHALSHDERFVQISTGGASAWYLSNAVPEAVRHKSAWLVPLYLTRGGEWLNRELRDYAQEILDEADELEQPKAGVFAAGESVQFFLNHPHRHEGTLPLSRQALTLLSDKPAERFMVTFVDQRSKEKMPGWMIPAEHYAWGLGDWYHRHELPVGSVIELRRTDDPYTFLVSYEERKRKSDWIREARVFSGRLIFSIQRKAYDCRFDKHLLVDEGNAADLDRLWVDSTAEADSLPDCLAQVFPELAKLSGQGLVNAKALYSAVNLTRRCGTVPIFAELTRRACFDPVGDGNWVYDESLRNVVYNTAEEMSRRPSSHRQDLIVDRVYAYGTNNNEGKIP